MSRLRLPAVLIVLATALTGCSAAEPSREWNSDHERPVSIAVSDSSPEQLLLGEIYRQVLQEEERGATLRVYQPADGASGLDRLRAAEVDMVVGCTGSLLHELDPQRARELADEIESEEVEDPADATYRAFMGALPGTITAPDPSSAQGCATQVRADGVPELPEAILPVYSRDVFDRDERDAITAVTRFLTTAEIESLLEDAADADATMSSVVKAWLGN